MAYRPVVHNNTIQSLLAIIRAMGQLRIDFSNPDRVVSKLTSMFPILLTDVADNHTFQIWIGDSDYNSRAVLGHKLVVIPTPPTDLSSSMPICGEIRPHAPTHTLF